MSTTSTLPTAPDAAAPSADFWRRKLGAYLHDSPTKPLDIRTHEDRAERAVARVGDDAVGFDKNADHTAAAADRLPFPSSRASGLSCDFDGVHNRFRHPLGGQASFPISRPFATVAQAEENEQITQPAAISLPDDWNAAQRARADFFAHWRLWSDHAVQRDARFALLPADTRIPDHTIWNHLAVTAAFATCERRPAFLKFQLGPVQDFIAAARSTRDLWSGSFLISWLMMAGIKRLSELAGPDAVIFPNLRGQPLFDLHWRGDLWLHTRSADAARSHWDSFAHPPGAFTTPNLPNVFLALVPADSAAEIARAVERAIRDEWARIADATWAFAFKPAAPAQARRARFDHQVARHLSLAWHTTPFPATLDDAESDAKKLLPDAALLERFRTFRRAFENDMPAEHRDGRFYEGGTNGPKEKKKLNNIGNAWPLLVAINAWQLDAVRQTRAFAGVHGGWDTAATSHNAKDALTGREEMITGGSEEILDSDLTRTARDDFKHNDEVGAITLVKRLWHRAYLCREAQWKDVFHPDDFAMPNTRSLAQGHPWANDADANLDDINDELDGGGKYFAILAFDGDDMGKWVSGAKMPALRDQLADYTDSANGERKGALEYFKKHAPFAALLDAPRLLTPSTHLQFSQALSNFALHTVPRIVAAHGGRLLYAGGDDVLAMLPAPAVFDCADDLQRAFRGAAPKLDCGIRSERDGFLTFDEWETKRGEERVTFPAIADDNAHPIPVLVPGACATASCGIAIAHYKAPLQDVVRAAQAAEKRAKRVAGKHAFAVSLAKRSGEIAEWEGGFANEHALDALRWIRRAIEAEVLSAKFPHKLLEFLKPYCSDDAKNDVANFPVRDAVARHLTEAMNRQQGKNYNTEIGKDERARIYAALAAYAESLSGGATGTANGGATAILEKLIGLLTTAAFLARQPDNR